MSTTQLCTRQRVVHWHEADGAVLGGFNGVEVNTAHILTVVCVLHVVGAGKPLGVDERALGTVERRLWTLGCIDRLDAQTHFLHDTKQIER